MPCAALRNFHNNAMNENPNNTPYVTACPVGCGEALLATNLHLPEGPLRRCARCGQLISAASESRYWETMASFNASGFNQPTPKEVERRRKVAARRLKTLARLTGKSPADTRLIDIGCSRGQFVDFAAQAGFIAEGVERPDQVAYLRKLGVRLMQGYFFARPMAATEFVHYARLRQPLARAARRAASIATPRATG